MTGADQPPSLTRRTLSGALWLGLLGLVHSLGHLGMIVLVNYVHPDPKLEVGLSAVVVTVALLSSLFFEGALAAVFKQRRDLSPGAAAGLSWIQAGVGLAAALALLLLAEPIARRFDDFPTERMADFLRFTAPIVFLTSLAGARKALLERELSFARVARFEAGPGVLAVAVGLILAPRYGATGIVVAAIVRLGLESSLLCLFGPLPLVPPWRALPWREIAGHLRFAAAMVLQAVCLLVRMLDVLVVGLLVGPMVAVYQMAKSLADLPISRLMAVVMRPAFSTFARVQDDPDRLLRGLVKLQTGTALAVLPALCGLAAVAPRLLWLLLGDAYFDDLPAAVTTLRTLCAAGLVFVYSWGVAGVLNASGAAGPMLLRQAVGAAAILAALVGGERWGGFEGLVLARGAAGVVAGSLFLELAWRRLGFGPRQVWRSVRQALPASVVMLAVVVGVGLAGDALSPQSAAGIVAAAGADRASLTLVLALQIGAGVAAYGVALLLLGVRPREVVQQLRGE